MGQASDSSAMVHCRGKARVHFFIESPQKLDGLQVFPAAYLLDPLALLCASSRVQHGGHRVHAQPVDVILVQPEQGAADSRKLAHFAPAVIEDVVVPFGVDPPGRVGMFVQVRSVETAEAMFVTGKMARAPNPE